MTRPGHSGRGWLVAGAALSAAAAAIHLGAIIGGGEWYRFFGAGERLAQMADRGLWLPAVLATAIAAVLLCWATYALSGAGVIRRLPLVRFALVAITAIYLARGMALFEPGLLGRPDLTPAFIFWSSAIVLAYGLVHLVGTWRAWPRLSNKELA